METTSEYEEAIACYEETVQDSKRLLSENQQLRDKLNECQQFYQQRMKQELENSRRLQSFYGHPDTEYDWDGRFTKMGNVRKLDEVELRDEPCCEAWMAEDCGPYRHYSRRRPSPAYYAVRIGDGVHLFCGDCLRRLSSHAMRVVGQQDQIARSRTAQRAAKTRWG